MYAKYEVKYNEIVLNKLFNNFLREAVKILLFAEIFKTKLHKALKKFMVEKHFVVARRWTT